MPPMLRPETGAEPTTYDRSTYRSPDRDTSSLSRRQAPRHRHAPKRERLDSWSDVEPEQTEGERATINTTRTSRHNNLRQPSTFGQQSCYTRKVPDGRRVQTSSGFSCSEEPGTLARAGWGAAPVQPVAGEGGVPVHFVATSPANTLGSSVFSFLRRHLPRCRSSGAHYVAAAHEQRAVTSVLLPGILKGAGGGNEARLLPLLRARLSSLSDKRDAVASSPAALRRCSGKRQRRRTRVHPGRRRLPLAAHRLSPDSEQGRFRSSRLIPRCRHVSSLINAGECGH